VTVPAVHIVCGGCGHEADPDDLLPFVCPNAGDGGDHVLARVLDRDALAWPAGGEDEPFVRYRSLLFAYHQAMRHGWGDDAFVELVRGMDGDVAAVEGHGFRVTPFGHAPGLDRHAGVGEVWVKDETRNVSGSHKGRHLMGLLILFEVAARAGVVRAGEAPLAIASCGNAALAAAVVARSAERPLDVFVPDWADPAVLDRLAAFGARINVAPRPEGVPGDPTYRALHDAVRDGALPFTCQGPDNGLTVEGGELLAYEMVDQARDAGVAMDRVVVQVGGGALASAVVGGLRDAVALGALAQMPRVHAVQSEGAHPLARAYERVAARLLEALGEEPALAGTAEGADRIREGAGRPEVREVLRAAAADRASYMWPWETPPTSIATGILDDETYDWLAVVRGMVETGGYPVVVPETTLERANALAHAETGIEVDHTGTAGLAGLLELGERGALGTDERVAVLFTGAVRDAAHGGTDQTDGHAHAGRT